MGEDANYEYIHLNLGEDFEVRKLTVPFRNINFW